MVVVKMQCFYIESRQKYRSQKHTLCSEVRLFFCMSIITEEIHYNGVGSGNIY